MAWQYTATLDMVGTVRLEVSFIHVIKVIKYLITGIRDLRIVHHIATQNNKDKLIVKGVC